MLPQRLQHFQFGYRLFLYIGCICQSQGVYILHTYGSTYVNVVCHILKPNYTQYFGQVKENFYRKLFVLTKSAIPKQKYPELHQRLTVPRNGFNSYVLMSQYYRLIQAKRDCKSHLIQPPTQKKVKTEIGPSSLGVCPLRA